MDGQDEQDFVLVEKDEGSNDDFHLSPETTVDIQNWLQPTDYLADSSEYQKHMESRVSGTGHWIEASEIYQKWIGSSSQGSLWIKAPAGMGKSVLAATIASRLAKTEELLLFFFFRQIVATNHDPHSLVRDFISQVLSRSPFLQRQMKKYVDEGRSLDSISTNELYAHLVEALDLIPRVYCIIDALDEMDLDKESFVAHLVQLGRRKPESIKVVMTSRPLPRIETYLRDPSVLQIRLERGLVDKDISTYVDYRLKQAEQLTDDRRTAFKRSLESKAQGSFLYARLMVDELFHRIKESITEISLKPLDWLPRSLYDMYNGMLLDYSTRSGVPQDLQLAILRWVTHSTRPLRVLELAAMLDYTKSSALAHFREHSTGRHPHDTKAIVRTACGPLVEILPDETVSVIHHSFTEFLLDKERDDRSDGVHPQFPIILSVETHCTLATMCLKYLDCLAQWEVRPRTTHTQNLEPEPYDPSRLQDLNMKHPLVNYAMNNWYFHIRKLELLFNGDFLDMESDATDAVRLRSILDNFMAPSQHQLFFAWLDLIWPSSRDSKKLAFTGGVSPLHVAAWAGMTRYAGCIIKNGAKVHSRDWQSMTPLSWAALKGYKDTVALLIRHDSQSNYGELREKPLHFAALANHHEIVKQLLEAGANPLAKTINSAIGPDGPYARNRRETCLHYAIRSGSAESVSEMLPYIPIEYLNPALGDAVLFEKIKVVEVLLIPPAVSIDSHLSAAAKKVNCAIIKLLLARGADPSKSRPLHALAAWRSPTWPHQSVRTTDLTACFHILVSAGVDVNAVDNDGKTALHHSVSAGSSEVQTTLTRLLLENGADPVAKDKTGNTPLHNIQVRSDSSYIIDMLIHHGGDVTSVRPSDGKTPLHLAAEDIYGQDLLPMLKHVTDCNIVDSQGNTPLHSTIKALTTALANDRIGYKADMVTDLLEAGADPNHRNKRGLTPVHLLTGDGQTYHNLADPEYNFYFGLLRERVLPDLLAGGADLETPDYEGRSIFLRTIVGRRSKVGRLVPIWLNFGAKISARDHEGDTALHLLCRNGAAAHLVESLIEEGADAFAINNLGHTLLHEIARAGNATQLTQLLLKKGLDPIAQNHLGQTPLHIICGTMPEPRQGKVQAMLKTELIKCLDIEDNNGIRPIHLAATISEQHVAQLVAVGADAAAITKETRTVLHVASRARQSNVVGYILDQFSAIGRLDLVDLQDDSGMTALHEACRSGRPETVKLLLDAGAKVNLKARMGKTFGNTPLHACAAFEEENVLWSPIGRRLASKRTIDAAGMLIEDTNRPPLSMDCKLMSTSGFTAFKMFHPTYESKTDTSTVRVRDIVEMLIEHGADVEALNCPGLSPIDMAIDAECEEMVEVLFPHMEVVYERQNDIGQSFSRRRYQLPGTKFAELYLGLRGSHVSSILNKEIIVEGEGNTNLCAELLARGKTEALKELPRLGVDFTPRPGKTGFLEILTLCGYSTLLETLGKTVKEHWVDGQPSADNKQNITSFLAIACRRTLPNLDVIKVLVEKLSANVNFQPAPKLSGHETPVSTALHTSALGGQWWHIKALEYLLLHQANPELKYYDGETVLHVAVRNYGSHTRREASELLLKHGANPNALDKNDFTCLNKAVDDIELTKVLIAYGADINLGTKPAIFSAIEDLHVNTVALLLECGADANFRSTYNTKDRYKGIPEHDMYPLLSTASEFFNLAKYRDRAVAIAQLLLKKAADPFLAFNNAKEETTIFHHLLEHGGSLQPFLEIPNLALERRDPQGRTLLLAACRSSFGTTEPATITKAQKDLHAQRRNLEERKEEEKINFATETTPAQKLYDLGSNLLAWDNDGNNPLHFLLSKIPYKNSHFDKTLALFIEKAPSLMHQKNQAGFKPLHIAIRTTRQWPIETLLAAGADIREPDPEGNTILHFLADGLRSQSLDRNEGLRSQINRYISLGVSINSPNSLGETPVFWYFRTEARIDLNNKATPDNIVTDSGTSRLTGDLGAFADASMDLFHTDNEGETLLHIVSKRLCGILPPKFGSVNEMNKEKELYEKKTKDMVNSFQWLLEKGLDPMIEDVGHRTALDVAAACGNEGILELFREEQDRALKTDGGSA